MPLLTAAATPEPAGGVDGLVELGIEELRRRMADSRLDTVTLTAFYLRRIERMNLRGPVLRAVIEVSPDAMGWTGNDGPAGSGARCTAFRCC